MSERDKYAHLPNPLSSNLLDAAMLELAAIRARSFSLHTALNFQGHIGSDVQEIAKIVREGGNPYDFCRPSPRREKRSQGQRSENYHEIEPVE